jgi:predicted metal-dependent peptidase
MKQEKLPIEIADVIYKMNYSYNSKNDSINLPFYANFLGCVNFHRDDRIPTIGVNISLSGMNMYYNLAFVQSLKQSELFFVIIHEVFHLLFGHNKRTTRDMEHKLANIVTDWIVNFLIGKHHECDLITVPKDNEGKNMGTFLPKEYDGDLVFEPLYVWALEQRNKMEEDEKTKGDGGEGEDNKDNNDEPNYGKHGKGGRECWDLKSQLSSSYTEFDTHIENTVSDDLAEQIKESIIDKLKAIGNIPLNMERIIEALNPPPFNNPLNKLRSLISTANSKRIKDKTWTKLSRREDEGFKGKKYRGSTINVLLDTSGSMSSEYALVLSYLLNAKCSVNLIQCDTNPSDVTVIHNQSDVKKLVLLGGGGTVLQPGINKFKTLGLSKNPIAILTDGYTDTLDFSGFSSAIILYTDKPSPVSSNSNVEQIKIGK